jgi:hypothetical protein
MHAENDADVSIGDSALIAFSSSLQTRDHVTTATYDLYQKLRIFADDDKSMLLGFAHDMADLKREMYTLMGGER